MVSETLPVRDKAFEWRGLTEGEIALGRQVFEPGGAWEAARVLHTPLPGRLGIVPFGRTIVFTAAPAIRDFSTASLALQGWFIHELTHVWQASQGTILALAKFTAMGRWSYEVKLKPGKPWAHYNIEQQAEIVRLVFLSRSGAIYPPIKDSQALEALWTAHIERTSRKTV